MRTLESSLIQIIILLAMGCPRSGPGLDDGSLPDDEGDSTVSQDGTNGGEDGAVGHGDGGLDDQDGRSSPTDGDNSDGSPPLRPECPTAEPLLPGFTFHSERRELTGRCEAFDFVLSPLKGGVIRLRYLPSIGTSTGTSTETSTGSLATIPVPSYAVLEAQNAAEDVSAGTEGNEIVLCGPEFTARVRADGCRVKIQDASGNVIVEDGEDGGFRILSSATEETPTRAVHIARVSRKVGDKTRIYGLGEKTGFLDRRGRKLTFWNKDAYEPEHGGFPPGTDPLYLSIPFFVGLEDGHAYGIFTDSTYRSTFDLAAAESSSIIIESEGPDLVQYVLLGPTIGDVITRYTALTGRMPMPPVWSLGYHQSRWGYSPASRLETLASEFKTRDLPAHSLWLDIQHMHGFRTFTWDPVHFPDPKGLAERLKRLGFELVVIADPGIKVDDEWAVYQEGLAGDHFLRDAKGELYVGQVWPGSSVFPDFSRRETRKWWSDHVAALAQTGVSGIWLDVNEPTIFPESGQGNSVPNDLVAQNDGRPTTMHEVHNVYALLQAEATRAGLLAARPEERPFILSRSGYAGIQRYAAVWTGDATSTWASLEETLPMLLGMGLSGLAFVGTDVGGYSGHATPELFARWMALGSISPFFRGHVTTNVNDQEPWAFGSEVEAISRSFMKWRESLLPYWYSLFREASEQGTPILRPLVLEFQQDPNVELIGDQAMLGPWMLVAPILQQNAVDRPLYLPRGRWYEARSGAIFEGPATIRSDAHLSTLPTFIREGAIIPQRTVSWAPGENSALFIDLYPSDAMTHFELYEDDGRSFEYQTRGEHRSIEYSLERTASGARFSARRTSGRAATPTRPLVVRIVRADLDVEAVRVDGAPLSRRTSMAEALSLGRGYSYDADRRAITIVFAEVDQFTMEVDYDTSLEALRPKVTVRFDVQLPEGTADGDSIYLASSVNGWLQNLLGTASGGQVSGSLEVPIGTWFSYKYTRGSWATVEKTADCAEVSNREAFAIPERKSDIVARWRGSGCP